MPQQTDSDTIDRRTVLTTGSALAAGGLAAMAGCLGESESTDSDGQARADDSDVEAAIGTDVGYQTLLANEDDLTNGNGLFFVYANFERVDAGEEWEYEGLEWSTDDDDEWIDEADRDVLDYGAGTLLFLSFTAFGELQRYGFGEYSKTLESDGETVEETTGYDLDVDEMAMIHGATVLTGEFDTDEIDDHLLSEPEESPEFESGKEVFEEIDELHGYTLYEGDEGSIIAVSEESLVLSTAESDLIDGETDEPVMGDAFDPRDQVETVLDAHVGDVDRQQDTSDGFAWVVEQADDPDILIGGYAAETEDIDTETDEDPLTSEAFSTANGFTASMNFTAEEATSTVVASYPDETPIGEDELDELLAEESEADAETEVFEDRLAITGTWGAT